MQSIVFNVRPDLKEEGQANLLADVGALPGVRKAAALRPNSKNASVRRMYYAEVADGVDVNALVGQITALSGVETASVPAERRLV